MHVCISICVWVDAWMRVGMYACMHMYAYVCMHMYACIRCIHVESTCIYIHTIPTCMHACMQAGRQAGRLTDRLTDRQTDRQTRHADIRNVHMHIDTHLQFFVVRSPVVLLLACPLPYRCTPAKTWHPDVCRTPDRATS